MRTVSDLLAPGVEVIKAPHSSVTRAGALRWVRAAVVAAVVVASSVAGIGPTAAGASDAAEGQVIAPAPSFDGAAHFGGGALSIGALDLTIPANTDFAIDYGPGVDDASRTVIEAAAGIWSSVLTVEVPIALTVDMSSLGVGFLGAAGPTSAFYGRADFPRRDTLYPVALANQFAGIDLDPANPDIDMVLSSTVAWDKAIDGNVSGQSMLSVALHELGHGLGLTSWVREVSGGYRITFDGGASGLALAYDRFVASADRTLLISVDPSLLTPLVTGPLVWLGPQAVTTHASPLALYSPASFEAGSSIGHLDEATFTSELMTPYLGVREPHTAISALTVAMLRDTGWTATAPTSAVATVVPEPTTTSAAPTPGELAAAFVEAIATDFLGRPATAAEIDSWTSFLLAGGSRSTVTQEYASSDEWIGVLVDGLYRSTLGRDADPAGRVHWITLIRSGVTPAEVASYFYASDEYVSRAGGTVPAWIGDLYAEVLGRQPDAAGLAYWVDQAAGRSRESIAYDFYQSTESRQTRVADLFERLLGRAPDAGGWAYWADILRNGRDVELATFLAASPEYLLRSIDRFA